MSKKAAVLGDRGVVSVSGADAAGFLQGLLTNDIEGLEPGEARYAALLTPQGKILFDMIVVRAPDADGAAYLLDCAAAQAPELARRLGFYKLRAKVTIADVSAGRAVAAFWGDEPAGDRGRPYLRRSARSRAWAGGQSCPARPQAPSGRSTSTSMRACASAPSRRRAGSISPTATPSRTTSTSTFCMASISTRAVMSARRSFRA